MDALKGKNPFGVPVGYFEAFPERMECLLLLRKPAPFKVPEGYFEGFSERVLRLTLQRAGADSFAVPEGYFSAFPSRVEQRVAPVSQTGWTVPDAYFDDFARRVQHRIAHEQRSPVRAPLRVVHRPALALAAACLVLLVGWAGWNAFFTDAHTGTASTASHAPAALPAALPAAEVLAYVDEDALAEAVSAPPAEVSATTESKPQHEATAEWLMNESIDEATLAEHL